MKKSPVSSPWEGLAEGQVLQRLGARGARLRLSGPSPVDGPVVAALSRAGRPVPGWKARLVGRAGKGRFLARLDGIPAGGPYRLELRTGKRRLGKVASFFVGDVWILAGQSNMEGSGVMEGRAKPHPAIRAFSLRRAWRLAEDPLHVLAESPDSCHAERQCTPGEGEARRRETLRGVGPGLFFAREMMARAGIPQGLICAAHGGTRMQEWDPKRRDLGGASLYASMLASVQATGQPVAGVLWYQGESDASPSEVPHYAERMRELVAAARRDLGQPGLPWAIVQLGRLFCLRGAEETLCWNAIREAQRLLPARIRNLETVAAIDLGMEDAIHIGSAGYGRLGARLARAAALLVPGARADGRPPRVAKVGVPRFVPGVGRSVDVTFADVRGGLRSVGEAAGFSLVDAAGTDLKMVHKVTLHGDTARLHFNIPSLDGLRVAYGYGTMPACTIVDGRDESPLAFAPIPLEKPVARFPFVRAWRSSGIVAGAGTLREVTPAAIAARGGEGAVYPGDFVNEHARWEGRSGHHYFSTRITLPEPMRLAFLMGYDGPFRLWAGGKLLFEDYHGTNPARIDHVSRPLSLAAGTHDVAVAMDLNEGKAWGFFLRFRRLDVPFRRIASGEYSGPVYENGAA